MKGLRGGPFDVFGRAAERRAERRLIVDYEATVDELVAGLTAENRVLAAEIAALPEDIRGFGHVKQRRIERVRAREAALLARFRSGAAAAMPPLKAAS